MSETAVPAGEPPRAQAGAFPGASPPVTTARRLAWLDVLRGFAALCVVFDHGSTLLLLPVRSFLYHWLNLGQYGVFVFFLVSGYIVPASLERKGSVRGFWISRAFRLYPMFVVAVGASVIAGLVGLGPYFGAGAHPLAAILAWLFMLQNLNSGLNVPVVTWTLSYEMVFYLLLAALFSWGAHRRSGWYASGFAVAAVALGGVLPMSALAHWSRTPGHSVLVLVLVTDALILTGLILAVGSRTWAARAGASVAALTALVLMLVNQNYPYPWSGPVILALMFTGTLLYRAEQRQVGRATAAAVALGVLALATLAGVWHGARYGHHWEVQWVTSVLLAGATFGLGLAVRRWRLPRWCAWLGMISYSLYLLHPLVFDAYRQIPALHRPHTEADQWLIYCALLAVIVALSALTYYLVEKPMQRAGRRAAAWAGNGTGTGPAEADSARGGTGEPAAASRSASSSTPVAGGSGGSP